MANGTDKDWETHKQNRTRMIAETDLIIAQGNNFLGIEDSVKSVKECSNKLENLIDAPKYDTLSNEQKREHGEKFIDEAMDSIYELSGKLGSTYVADSDVVHLLRTIRNKFQNGNISDSIYDLLTDSSKEIDEIGNRINEHRNLNVYDYL